MKNRIITINREFGSGGREIGKRLSDILKIPYYDKEIVTQIAQRTQLVEDYVSRVTENGAYIAFPITTGRSFYPAIDPYMTQAISIYIEQSNILKELAEKSDCIIVGRCANYVLRKYEPLRVFTYAELDYKIQRCREKAPEHEDMTDKQLKQYIADIDKGRAGYYKFVTGEKWNNMTNYDLCLNTTFIPIKKAAYILSQFYREVNDES